jgi:uncharacterized protein YbjQ (UPF0145 family)
MTVLQPSDMQKAIAAVSTPAPSGARSVTSDLTIDETLLLHGMGFEPTDLVTGVSVMSIPWGTFNIAYGQSSPVELPYATQAVIEGFRIAQERICHEAANSGGIGVVGVSVDVEIEQTSVTVTMTGTSVRDLSSTRKTVGRPFMTDLSVRDFALLLRGGWAPLDLVSGASFVGSPMRGFRQTLAQAGQNVELTTLTQALQDAREKAMERMQSAALGERAEGVVDVKIIDGPLGHSRHILVFICYGTAVHLTADSHQRIEPDLVLSIDDNLGFEAASLR